MKNLIPLTAIMAGLLLFSGCTDHRSEIEDLEARVATNTKKLNQQREELEAENDKLRAELDRLNQDIALPADSESVSSQLSDLKSRVTGVEGSDSSTDTTGLEKRLNEKIDAIKADVTSLETARAVDKEEMAAVIDKKMAEESAANAPTKSLDKALDRLDISQAEKDQIEQHILDSKKETLELLEIPTADGRSFAEELIDTVIASQKSGNNSSIMKLFAELQSTKIPGDIEGRTYAEALDTIKKQNKEDISRMLSEEDRKKLSNAHEDWSDFDVENDPFTELYMERLLKSEEESEND
ncbi:MAG: hypothetical protein L3J82_00885 [Planctomycetes bacterium]|nr:hypothetical protein [Planctomycetota bacterium]